jgi:hypothetical protein
MATWASNDMLRVVTRFRTFGVDDISNVWHFITGLAGTATEAAIKAAVEAWLDAVFSPILGYISSAIDPYDIKLDFVEWNVAKQTTQVKQALSLGPWVMAVPPSASGDSLPRQTSPMIQLRTDRPKTKGRRFLPVFSEAAGDSGGYISAAAYANLVLSAAQMLDPVVFGTVDWWPGVPTPYSGSYPNFRIFESGLPTVTFVTQRRRRASVGS